MANTCYNMYWITCENPEKAKKLCDFLNSQVESNKNYLDDVMKAINLSIDPNKDYRDDINSTPYIGADGQTVLFSTDSAWTPHPNSWNLICKEFDPYAKLLYYAEEPGCEIFASNHPNIVQKYFIDILLEKSEWYGIHDKKEIIGILQLILSTKVDDINHLIDLVHQKDFGEEYFVNIYPIKYTPLEDWSD